MGRMRETEVCIPARAFKFAVGFVLGAGTAALLVVMLPFAMAMEGWNERWKNGHEWDFARGCFSADEDGDE